MRLVRLLSGESFLLFALAIAASILSGTLTMGILLLLFRILHSEGAGVHWLAFVGVAAAVLGTHRLSQLLLGHIGRKAVMDIRISLARQIVQAPLADLERIGSARLIGSLTSDVGAIASVLPTVVVLGANLSFVAICLAYLGWLSPARLVLILAVIAIGLTIHHLLQREGFKHVRASRNTWDDLLRAFHVLVDGAKELRLNAARRDQAVARFNNEAALLRSSAKSRSAFFGGAASGMQALFYAALGIAVFFDGSGSRELVINYCICIIFLMAPLRSITGATHTFRQAEVGLDRVQELGLKLEQAKARRRRLKPHDGVGPRALGQGQDGASPRGPGPGKELRLIAVTHTYRGGSNKDEFTLGPLDLTLNRGEIVFVAGANGSGKTTLSKILTGLYAPQQGKIVLDGQIITEANRGWYRQHFSAVFSDFFLFDSLVASDETAGHAASDLLQRLHIAGKVQIESEGQLANIETLSLGERKRLALAMARLDDRPIYLFDEWSAEQDPAFKDLFYREILPGLRSEGKSVVVISHDERYFDVADKIIRLERGRPPSVDQRALEAVGS